MTWLFAGDFKENLEVQTELASLAPYGEWLEKHRTVIEPSDAFTGEVAGDADTDVVQMMTAFGWSAEDLDMQVADMSDGGKETLAYELWYKFQVSDNISVTPAFFWVENSGKSDTYGGLVKTTFNF